MRTRLFLSIAVLLLAFIFPAVLRAQFQAPTDEELKMTSDPDAPGAAAVYLYREDVADDPGHLHSYYERVKILTEKGKELATVRFPYQRGESKVAVLTGRTIHSDGTVIPLDVKPEDLANDRSPYFQQNMLVFTLPGVEVGSILEYRVQFRYPDGTVFSPTWHIQQPYFVRKAHYSFRPGQASVIDSLGATLDNLMWSATSKQIDVEPVKDSYVADLTDIPPIPDEEWMPPLNAIEWTVRFTFTDVSSGDDFWKSEGDRWAVEMENLTRPSETLKNVAASLVSAQDSEEVKARKIYAAVMQLENTDFSPGKTDADRKQDRLKNPAGAEEVWNKKSGSANEIALLYAALARAAGLDAWPMKVVNRSRAVFDAGYLSMGQLEDVLVVASIDNKDVYLDPGEKMCPFGSLDWEHELVGGLRASATASTIATTPAADYKQNQIERTAELDLDEQGNLSGTARYTMTGSRALYWRQLALEDNETEVKTEFCGAIRSELPKGVDCKMDYFAGLDDYESDLIAVVDVSGSIGAPSGAPPGATMTLPGLFFEAGITQPFVSNAKRMAPIDLRYAEQEQDDVTYDLPGGFTVESAPKTAATTMADEASFQIDSAAANSTLEVVRAFARGTTLFSVDDYANLHDFYRKLAAADQQQIVLARPEAVKGN